MTVNVAEEYKRVQQDLKTVGDDIRHYAGEMKESVSEVKERVFALEQLAASGGGNGGGLFSSGIAAPSVGQCIAQDEQLNALRDGKVKNVIIPSDHSIKQLRAAIIGEDSSSHDAYPVQPDRAAGIWNDPRRALRIIDMIQRIEVNSNAFEFVAYDSFVNAADYQDMEGDLKPSQDVPTALRSRPIRTIAVTAEASEQVLQDVPQLTGILNTKLTYGLLEKLETELVNGSGGAGISGLVAEATAFTPSSSADAADAIGEALAELQVSGWNGGVIVMHPRAWHDLRAQRDNEGRYLMGNAYNPIGQTLWGVPVITSASASESQAMVMDPSQVALLDRMAPRFQVGVIDDQFARNMVTLRAELRAGLAVFAPSAVLKFAIA